MQFTDRHQAGRLLAERLMGLVLADPFVLALPRGGVPVGYEVARALGCPLDVLVVRKIGAPHNPELGVGAVTVHDPPYYNKRALDALGLSEDDLDPVAERERREALRRVSRYREGRGDPDLSGRSVIVVDDGVATGGTAHAALRSVRHERPGRLIVAIPVCAPETADELREVADDLICLYTPDPLLAVGVWYDGFPQLTDDAVISLLAAASSR